MNMSLINKIKNFFTFSKFEENNIFNLPETKYKKPKGIILAGGAGTRLYPLTKCVPKSLIPLYNKPTIYYPLNTLKKMGCRDILIICQSQYLDLFKKLLNNGEQFNLNIEYAIQDIPNGIAEAFIIGEDFIRNDNVILCLGDNVFLLDDGIQQITKTQDNEFCNICEVKVSDASKYGVYDREDNIIIEKPKTKKYKYAFPGIYAFDKSVCEKAKNIKPSARGELEITSLIDLYRQKNKLNCNTLKNAIWVDTGTHNDLLEACNLIKSIEERIGEDVCETLYK